MTIDTTADIRAHWDEVAETWRRDRPDQLWRLHSDAVNTELVERWLPAGGLPGGRNRLLKTDLFDEAITGGLYAVLTTRARLVVGMDLSAVTARTAREQGPELVAACADARALPFANGAFDVILSNSTLDHFPTFAELTTSLRELHRVLHPGGQLIITLDNRANPVVAARNAVPFHWLKRAGIMPYYVGVTYGPRGLKRALEDTGWEVREMTSILHCPRFLSIKLAEWLRSRGSPETQARYLRWLLKFETLARWPTRYLTGYFVAARAVRRSGPSQPTL